MSHKLLNVDEVSNYLNIPKGTLANWRAKGYGPEFLKIGRHIFYRESDLEKFIDSCLRYSTKQEAAS